MALKKNKSHSVQPKNAKESIITYNCKVMFHLICAYSVYVKIILEAERHLTTVRVLSYITKLYKQRHK